MHSGQRLPRSLFILVLALLATGVLTPVQASEETAEALSPEWDLVSDHKGIQVYMRHGDQSRLKTFRGVTRITLEDEYALAALLNDYDSFPRWLHFIHGAEEISRDGPLRRNMRLTTRLPWPLRNREAVVQADVNQILAEDEDSIMIHMTNRPELIPPNDDYVRFPELNGVFGARRLGDNQLEVIYEMVLDPGGYIPAWLANILLRDAPYYTLSRLRRVINEPEYQGHYYEYIDLRGPGRPPDAQPDPSAWQPEGDDTFPQRQ